MYVHNDRKHQRKSRNIYFQIFSPNEKWGLSKSFFIYHLTVFSNDTKYIVKKNLNNKVMIILKFGFFVASNHT